VSIDSVAVVTGAARGIGEGIALRLAEDGWKVAVVDILDGAADVAAAITSSGGTAAAFKVDITQTESVVRGRQDIIDQLGQPSVLVNNAGWEEIRKFEEGDDEFWEKIVAINYLGTLRMCREFLEDLKAAGDRGRFINIASDAGRVGSTGEAPYSGAKGGIIAFTKTLAREVARYGPTANVVCPGPTETPLMKEQPEALMASLVRAVPFRRLAKPADIANAVSFFASARTNYVTGQTLSVSGGLTMAG
jgi:2-hydroxycyclohexanecarboxyl-CoA dehydrogenase